MRCCGSCSRRRRRRRSRSPRIALGGYGRRQLCLWSDIDLLVLFEGPIGAADERFLHGFLNPLWDLGVVVGQQVRELADFSTLEADNPEFLLALVDARPLAGDRTLFERFTVTFHQPATHAHIVASLVDLIDARHARFNDTLYQLEPDVKEAPGALRDLTAARTIASLTDPTLLTPRSGRGRPSRGSGGLSASHPLDAAPDVRPQPERADATSFRKRRPSLSATPAPSRSSRSSG